MSVRDGYSKTRTAPSGRTYVYRGLNPFEIADVYEGLPMIGSAEYPKGQSDLVSRESRDKLQEEWRRICVLGSISPRIVPEDTGDPETLPFSHLGMDMSWLYTKILEATGLSGSQAQEASSFRKEQAGVSTPLRNGRGSRRKAVRDHVGRVA